MNEMNVRCGSLKQDMCCMACDLCLGTRTEVRVLEPLMSASTNDSGGSSGVRSRPSDEAERISFFWSIAPQAMRLLETR